MTVLEIILDWIANIDDKKIPIQAPYNYKHIPVS